MKQIVLMLIILFGSVFTSFGLNQPFIDSLKKVIKTASHDTSVCTAYLAWGGEVYLQNPDTAIVLWTKAYDIATGNLQQKDHEAIENNFSAIVAESLYLSGNVYERLGKRKKGLANFLHSLKLWEEISNRAEIVKCLDEIAYIYNIQNEITKSLENYNRSIKIKQEIGDLAGIATVLNNISIIYKNQAEFTQALDYGLRSLNMREGIADSVKIANGLSNIGAIYQDMGEITKSVDYFHRSLKVHEGIGNKEGIASSLSWIAYVYDNQGDIPKSLEFYHRSLKIREGLDDKEGIARVLSNIASIYNDQGEITESLEYNEQALKIREEIGDNYGIATGLNNIGSIYRNQGDTAKAMDYYHRSLKIFEETKDKRAIAISLHNIGVIYQSYGDIKQGLEYIHRSLKIREEIGDKQGLTFSLFSIGVIYYDHGDLDQAKKHTSNSLVLARELGYPARIKDAANLLIKIYRKENNYKKAFEMYKLYVQMRDSINNEKTQKSAIKQEAKYRYEKQKAVDDAEHDKLLAIEQEEKEKQEVVAFSAAGGLVLVVLFLIFVFNRLRVTRRQRDEIRGQKQEIEEQKTVVETAHQHLEEKNKEILDSINYAKRIQSAILPPPRIVKEYLNESFILYKPKDVVAGDFYWMEAVADPVGNKVLFAAADCTGHGVPGAMVSVVCNNALNRAVREYGLSNPGKILDKAREIVIQEFEKSEEDVKDGMDIALCAISGNELEYAGANNPLWRIRNGEILETKADKQPIGKFDLAKPFTTHNFSLEKGDTIYVFSDGYVDQFGGEKGKKFKTKAFRSLLLGIQDKPMEEQKKLIDDAFENWRGELEQIDDVCVIGVKI